ncbi:MAG: DNA alkylation repair protein [Lachnospiraceae bacterium]|nr:DNA alkylation repair protein [Lachnospiraceae bacterium]
MLCKIREDLLSMAEPQYREFSAKLLPEGENLLGVRLPKLRKMAKQIWKRYGRMYLDTALASCHGEEYTEEIFLQGMVIGNLKAEKDMQLAEIFNYIERYVPKIKNWSTCDSFCAGLKITKQYPVQMWDFLQEYLTAEQEFTIRFGIVMIINYYINEEYFDLLFPIFNAIGERNHTYYVEMGLAWAISICYVKNPTETERYLQDMRGNPEVLNDFTYHKALQKIVESHCVSAEDKSKIRGMKR